MEVGGERYAQTGSTWEELPDNEIQIWHARPSETCAPELRILSKEERRRADGFRSGRQRHAYIVTRALVRTVLSRYGPVSPSEWQFTNNAYGKPMIAAPPNARDLRFSVSHTKDLVACGVAVRREMGIDVESLEHPNLGLRLAERFFSPAEASDLRSLPAWRTKFFEYWTLKEAYIKARGMGLYLPVNRLNFDLTNPRDIRVSFAPPLRDFPEALRFQMLYHLPGCLMALAFRVARKERILVRMGRATPPFFGRLAACGSHESPRAKFRESAAIALDGP